MSYAPGREGTCSGQFEWLPAASAVDHAPRQSLGIGHSCFTMSAEERPYPGAPRVDRQTDDRWSRCLLCIALRQSYGALAMFAERLRAAVGGMEVQPASTDMTGRGEQWLQGRNGVMAIGASLQGPANGGLATGTGPPIVFRQAGQGNAFAYGGCFRGGCWRGYRFVAPAAVPDGDRWVRAAERKQTAQAEAATAFLDNNGFFAIGTKCRKSFSVHLCQDSSAGSCQSEDPGMTTFATREPRRTWLPANIHS